MSTRRRNPRLRLSPKVSGWLPFYGAGMLTSALIVGEDVRQFVTAVLSFPAVTIALPLLVAFWWNATHSTPPAPVRAVPRTGRGRASASLGGAAVARQRETSSIAPGALRDAAVRAALPTEHDTVPGSRRLVASSRRAVGTFATAMYRVHDRLLPDPLARQISDAGIDLDEG